MAGVKAEAAETTKAVAIALIALTMMNEVDG